MPGKGKRKSKGGPNQPPRKTHKNTQPRKGSKSNGNLSVSEIGTEHVLVTGAPTVIQLNAGMVGLTESCYLGSLRLECFTSVVGPALHGQSVKFEIRDLHNACILQTFAAISERVSLNAPKLFIWFPPSRPVRFDTSIGTLTISGATGMVVVVTPSGMGRKA